MENVGSQDRRKMMGSMLQSLIVSLTLWLAFLQLKTDQGHQGPLAQSPNDALQIAAICMNLVLAAITAATGIYAYRLGKKRSEV